MDTFRPLTHLGILVRNPDPCIALSDLRFAKKQDEPILNKYYTREEIDEYMLYWNNAIDKTMRKIYSQKRIWKWL